MSVLYREYRSQKFSEVVGQEHVTITLLNALKNNQLGHAYLFTGPRGIGKTSVARILAKAVNCEQEGNVEPCNECDSCKAVTRGNFLDLVEIDAASNRGIDDVRALREQIHFQPSQGKYRTYVLDEVHMLTKEAFNAILKTLEEPPEHVIFILCTTEAHRLPATIISRCQRFDFQLAKEQVLVEFLTSISQKESLNIEPEVFNLIAEQARGSFRDALGLLEQVSVFTEDSLITAEKALDVLGLTPETEAHKIYQLLSAGEVNEAIVMIEGLAQAGKDINYFISRLVLLIRDKLRESLVRSTENGLPREGLVTLIDLLQEAMRESRWTTIPQLPLELALLKFAGQGKPSKGGNIITQLHDDDLGNNVSGKGKKPSSSAGAVKQNPRSKKVDLGLVWDQVMENVKQYNHSVHALLKGCKLENYEPGVIHLTFAYKFHKERISEGKNRKLVEEVFSKVLGEPVQVSCLLREGSVPLVSEKMENVSSQTFSAAEGSVNTDSLSEDDLIKMAQDILGGEVSDV